MPRMNQEKVIREILDEIEAGDDDNMEARYVVTVALTVLLDTLNEPEEREAFEIAYGARLAEYIVKVRAQAAEKFIRK